MFSHAPHRGKDLQEFPKFVRKNTPSLAQMTVEGERLVLGDNEYSAKAGVNAVGQSDIHNPIDAAKRHGRLGAIPGQWVKALALSSREEAHDGVASHSLLTPFSEFAAGMCGTCPFRRPNCNYTRRVEKSRSRGVEETLRLLDSYTFE
jgi:hypothetical protein